MLAGLALETVRVARIGSRKTLEIAVHIHLPGKSGNRASASNGRLPRPVS